MRHYEVVFLVHPDQSAQVPGMVERYSQLVTDSGGKVHRTEDWGRRQLAYPISKIHKAHYILMNIECGGEALTELSTLFRYNDAVIRDLVIKTREAVSEESLILKGERENRDRKARAEQRRKVRDQETEARETSSKQASEPKAEQPEAPATEAVEPAQPEAPAEEAVEPAKAGEAPAEAAAEPAKAGEAPTEEAVEPAEAGEAPAEEAAEPAGAGEAPAEEAAEPAGAGEAPAEEAAEPAGVGEAPRSEPAAEEAAAEGGAAAEFDGTIPLPSVGFTPELTKSQQLRIFYSAAWEDYQQRNPEACITDESLVKRLRTTWTEHLVEHGFNKSTCSQVARDWYKSAAIEDKYIRSN